ncbi:DUF1214 domain-containing protein [Flavobacterium sp.]|uniref:DUF1214 domain-containing protein n=1 Tax=Flavobacterium sp. TaxID=239 RepID=UPI0039C883EB
MDRYSIINKTKALKYEANGDLIIYLQSTSPGKDKESNWLLSPKNEKFMFVTPSYGPKPDVINDIWKMPLPQPAG